MQKKSPFALHVISNNQETTERLMRFAFIEFLLFTYLSHVSPEMREIMNIGNEKIVVR